MLGEVLAVKYAAVEAFSGDDWKGWLRRVRGGVVRSWEAGVSWGGEVGEVELDGKARFRQDS